MDAISSRTASLAYALVTRLTLGSEIRLSPKISKGEAKKSTDEEVLVGLVLTLSAGIYSFFLRFPGVNLGVKLINFSLSDLFVGEGRSGLLENVFSMHGGEEGPSEMGINVRDCALFGEERSLQGGNFEYFALMGEEGPSEVENKLLRDFDLIGEEGRSRNFFRDFDLIGEEGPSSKFFWDCDLIGEEEPSSNFFMDFKLIGEECPAA
jgi:hypothetical protein